jgi:hypothetical protein
MALPTGPFTDLEKARIRTYLGYPNMYRYRNTRLESAMDGLDEGVLSLVRAAMAEIEKVDLRITTDGLDSVGVKRVDEIELQSKSSNGGVDRLDGIRKVGRIYIARISKVLGTPINHGSDYFSPNGYQGDSWSTQITDFAGGKAVNIIMG